MQRRVGLHHALEQRDVVVGDPGILRGQEGKVDIVAGGRDDDVHALAAAVGKDHAIAIEPLDRRLDDDIAVRQPAEEFTTDGRVCLERAVIGSGQAIILHPTDRFGDAACSQLAY